MCYLCKESSHPTVLCPYRPVSEELMMYGHGIEGLGFFHMEVPEVVPSAPSLLAIMTVLETGSASPKMIAAELNHLCKLEWDWQVTSIVDRQF